jgi:GT2 family glycosyltransferase
MTLGAIASLACANQKPPHEIVVIGNASTDGSAAAIAKAFPDIILITEIRQPQVFVLRHYDPLRPLASIALNPDTVVA